MTYPNNEHTSPADDPELRQAVEFQGTLRDAIEQAPSPAPGMTANSEILAHNNNLLSEMQSVVTKPSPGYDYVAGSIAHDTARRTAEGHVHVSNQITGDFLSDFQEECAFQTQEMANGQKITYYMWWKDDLERALRDPANEPSTLQAMLGWVNEQLDALQPAEAAWRDENTDSAAQSGFATAAA